jgi:two-component system phosphate regulon sensor histidine kinase PhoR
MAQHMISLFRDRAQARQIRLETELATDMPLISADRRALEQVLTNLLDNAVKYATEGALVVLRAVPEHGCVRISVQDSGPGIEAKHLPRIFERFYRVDAGRSREIGGTGLGLSIVKHLVEAMDGHLGVESAPGQGTKFDFALPAAA